MRAAVVILLLTACSMPAARPPEKQKGISFAAAHPRLGTYGSPESAASLRAVKALGATWVTIMPFGFHRGTPALRWGGERVWETDEAVAAVTQQAHDVGLRVMLKPHVWGRIELQPRSWSEADWQAWLADYGRFAEHYARLARDSGADAFCLGNEQHVRPQHDAEWRAIIRRVRAVYDGPITYGANFDEVFDVPFWDAVDWIGVSGYFPLTDSRSPTRAELVRAWQPVLQKLEALSRRHRRPVVFTEIGYRSAEGSGWRQWEIPRDAPVSLDAQTNAYEAFFEAVWPQPWVAGAYPWKWFSYVGHGAVDGNDYDFESKPAAEVIRKAYSANPQQPRP